MKYAFVASAMLMLSTTVMAETTNLAGICGKYAPDLAELAANIQEAANLDEANDYINQFTQTHPDAAPCIGTNEQIAAALASVEPAAGDEDSTPTLGGEAEVPSQLNGQETEEEAPPEEESLPPPEEEEPYEYEKGPCEEQYYE